MFLVDKDNSPVPKEVHTKYALPLSPPPLPTPLSVASVPSWSVGMCSLRKLRHTSCVSSLKCISVCTAQKQRRIAQWFSCECHPSWPPLTDDPCMTILYWHALCQWSVTQWDNHRAILCRKQTMGVTVSILGAIVCNNNRAVSAALWDAFPRPHWLRTMSCIQV